MPMTDKEWIKFIRLNYSEGVYKVKPEDLISFVGQDRPKKVKATKLCDIEFVTQLKLNKAFSHIDIERELSKMDAWLMARPDRKKTRKFVVNWLNKQERPFAGKTNKIQELMK